MNRAKVIKDTKGMALVIVLIALAVLTAVVMEFVSNVHMSTDMLTNWRGLQRLSLASQGGTVVATALIKDKLKYDKPVDIIIPPMESPIEKGVFVTLKIEDECAKFNINKLVNDKGEADEKRYGAFVLMLEHLKIEKDIADRLVDWMDDDDIGRLYDSDQSSPNRRLLSTDEILQVSGIDLAHYDKLKDYITIYGDGKININLAQIPVLMTLSPQMGVEMAKDIIAGRKSSQYKDSEGLRIKDAVPGFVTLSEKLSYKYDGDMFLVDSTALDKEGLTRTTISVLDTNYTIHYWKEF